jgi:hypothetical protein
MTPPRNSPTNEVELTREELAFSNENKTEPTKAKFLVGCSTDSSPSYHTCSTPSSLELDLDNVEKVMQRLNKNEIEIERHDR